MFGDTPAPDAPIAPSHAAAAPKTGRVIWITGLSGAGKTAVATILKELLELRGDRTIVLDGDELRAALPLGNHFDRASRLALAQTYGRLCLLLANQSFTVICATISMHKEVYAWNRQYLPNYFEVYLDTPPQIRAQRDPKGYYAALGRGDVREFCGHDQSVDLPTSSDVHIQPKPDQSAQEITAHILSYL